MEELILKAFKDMKKAIVEDVLSELLQKINIEPIEEDVIDNKGLAQFLNIGLSSAKNLKNQYKDFPARKLGKKDIYLKSEIVEWIKKHGNYIKLTEFRGLNKKSSST